MKSLFIVFFVILSIHPAFTQEIFRQSHITSIDDDEPVRNDIEVSEEGLPTNFYTHLVMLMETFKFTPAPEETFRTQFEKLKKDSRARAKFPGGNCSVRRAYIQNILKKQNIISGRIFIQCPGNIGRLRLQDQVSGHWYSFSNFHDTNIVAADTPTGRHYLVMDLQFFDAPVTLHEYLTVIEANQKIRPLKTRGTGKNYCYWTISTPAMTY